MNEQLQQESIITRVLKKVKANQADIILGLAIILITVISFNLGKISAVSNQKALIKITGGENAKQAGGGTPVSKTVVKDQTVVASKNSKGKLYHFTWCPGASMIAEKNKITFASEAAAIAAGYILAGNCQK